MREFPLRVAFKPDCSVPTGREKLENKLKAESARYAGHVAVFNRSEGNDPVAGRDAAQSEANMNHLLDHYPDGVPRDWIAQYEQRAVVLTTGAELVVAENVVLGED